MTITELQEQVMKVLKLFDKIDPEKVAILPMKFLRQFVRVCFIGRLLFRLILLMILG